MRLTKQLKSAIHAHAQSEYPRECCGLVVNGEYVPCTNIALTDDQFEIDPEEFVRLSETGEIQAIVHSHPDGSAEPSEIDRVQMGLHGVDWVICAIGKDPMYDDWQIDIKRHQPKPYQAPLIGREYHHGVLDCYSLVRDYYQRELGIGLPDFKRSDGWWENANHEPLYENNFKKAGFEIVVMGAGDDLAPSLQKHDVILCRVGRTQHINHALIFIGNGKLQSESTPDCVGDGLVLHHPHGRLSVREVYGESWRKRAVLVVRHQSLG